MSEPTVLDYFKAKLAFWRHSDLRIPVLEPAENAPLAAPADSTAGETFAGHTSAAVETQTLTIPQQKILAEVEPVRPFPWRASLSLVLALIAQRALDPPGRSVNQGVFLYGLAALFLVWGVFAGEWKIPTLQPAEQSSQGFSARPAPLVAGLPLLVLTFLVFGSHLFTPLTVVVWFLTLGAFIYALWTSDPFPWARGWRSLLTTRRLDLRITPWTVLIALALILVVWFRVYRIADVPPEMTSDHAEKLLDVWDVLQGQTSVFFSRNTGREFFQFYLTAAVIKLLNTGISFLSLKIGTVLMGLLTLPYIYLIGKEVGNKRVGLYALLFAGIAYWPNVITRVALRFTLYPAFAAPVLYYLLRGLRTSNRNYFILAGIALGLGLNGYTSFRIMPFVAAAAVGLYLVHRQTRNARLTAMYGLIVTAVIAFILFIPLFRYALDYPGEISYRVMTRMGTTEQPLPGPALQIFLSNLWNACTMFFWSDGEIWVHSVPSRPALDTVSAALFFIGLVLVVVRYLRHRNWTDAFLLVSIPLLMMPSILSLAFPGENPSLNRTGGAIVPVFVLLAIGLDAFLSGLKERLSRNTGKWAVWSVGLLLLFWSATQNYDLVFRQYEDFYRAASWNTSEIGRVVRGFADSVGTPDTAWVIPYPYWVDTRLVGINAGFPTKDYAIQLDQIPATVAIPSAKLFILNREDTKGLDTLLAVYPKGVVSTHPSQVQGKEFLEYLVPPASGPNP